MLADVGAVEKFWKAFDFPNHIWKKKQISTQTAGYVCASFINSLNHFFLPFTPALSVQTQKIVYYFLFHWWIFVNQLWALHDYHKDVLDRDPWNKDK